MQRIDNQKPLTLDDLGKFTDDVLLPAIGNIVKDEIGIAIGKHRHEMKSYIDDKLAVNKGDIIAYIKGDQERDRNWKAKVVNILEKAKLAKPQDIEILTDLIR